MTLKWMGVVVAAVSATLFATTNVVVGALGGRGVPGVFNMVVIGVSGVAVILAVLAELHERLNARITALAETLVAQLAEVDSHTGDRNAGFVEGYLLSQSTDAAVVPIDSRARARRAMSGGDE
ncbi:MAG TPA: hypothetical protein VF462_07745 [Micromonosporaceae bacterium]